MRKNYGKKFFKLPPPTTIELPGILKDKLLNCVYSF